jgi:hypothetical protein
MQEVAHAALAGWESFYVVVGTSAAALTGLQFVVITLATDRRTNASTNSTTIDAFATPTIVHFCVALFVSATLSAPWPDLFGAAVMLSLCGLAGVLYSALIVWRATHQTGYKMVAEDWVWHVAFTALAYTALFGAGLMLRRTPAVSLFGIAGAALLLMYIGIHNAWDTTTYFIAHAVAKPNENGESTPPPVLPAESPESPAAVGGENR